MAVDLLRRSAIRADVSAGALVVWTWFVWGGRIRNALADPGTGGGTLVLAGSFVVLATALAVAVLHERRGRTPGPARVWSTWALALWTSGVWVVRAVDITLFGGHTVGFVLVHLVLAVTSVGLSVWSTAALRGVRSPLRTAAG